MVLHLDMLNSIMNWIRGQRYCRYIIKPRRGHWWGNNLISPKSLRKTPFLQLLKQDGHSASVELSLLTMKEDYCPNRHNSHWWNVYLKGNQPNLHLKTLGDALDLCWNKCLDQWNFNDILETLNPGKVGLSRLMHKLTNLINLQMPNPT